MKQYSFEKLRFWNDVRELVKEIYDLTKNYPFEERFGLVNQMRRAAISVSSNIAEGSSRLSFKDQAHFYQIAYSSLIELLSQIILSQDLGFCSDVEAKIIREHIEKVSIQINALKNAQTKRQ